MAELSARHYGRSVNDGGKKSYKNQLFVIFHHLQTSHCKHYRNHTRNLPSHNFIGDRQSKRCFISTENCRLFLYWYITFDLRPFWRLSLVIHFCINHKMSNDWQGNENFCFKYLNRNNENKMIMAIILRDGDHMTFI